MTSAFLSQITETLAQIDADGMTKRERMITSPQGGTICGRGSRSSEPLCQ